KRSSTQKGKFHFKASSRAPCYGLAPLESEYLILTGTCSHLRCDHLGDQKWKLSTYPPSLLSSGTHDRSQKTTRPFTKCSASHACAVGTQL
ncbi:unnamed protein product, partial [Staurois parvus]